MSPTDAKRGLETDERAILRGEPSGRLPQLQRVWIVLGVIDGQQVALCDREGVVQRAGFGRGGAGRRDQHLEPVRQGQVVCGVDGRPIVGFQDQIAIQKRCRVVEVRQPFDQMG
ncbi:hypothetical protein D3C72_814320 [compost metagenome]